MNVAGLWRYPVKSLQGEPVDTVRVETDGIAGDRQWGIRERAHRAESPDGASAARGPACVPRATATAYRSSPFRTGARPKGRESRRDRVLSAWLGSPVSLVSASDEVGRAEFFADATDDSSEAIELDDAGGAVG